MIPHEIKELILDFADPYNLASKKLKIHLELFAHFHDLFFKRFELADFDNYWTLVNQWDKLMQRAVCGGVG